MLCIPVWKNDRMKYIPLFLYSFRWNIETSYYEQKTFWSLCRYMVRSCKAYHGLLYSGTDGNYLRMAQERLHRFHYVCYRCDSAVCKNSTKRNNERCLTTSSLLYYISWSGWGHYWKITWWSEWFCRASGRVQDCRKDICSKRDGCWIGQSEPGYIAGLWNTLANFW